MFPRPRERLKEAKGKSHKQNEPPNTKHGTTCYTDVVEKIQCREGLKIDSVEWKKKKV